MKNSVRIELLGHILTCINDGVIDDNNRDDWHFHCFNEDYYIIGYYEAEQWLKRHDIGAFEAISICQEYELDNFGEARVYDNAEKVVNMLTYIWGEELLSDIDAENIEELTEQIQEIIR